MAAQETGRRKKVTTDVALHHQHSMQLNFDLVRTQCATNSNDPVPKRTTCRSRIAQHACLALLKRRQIIILSLLSGSCSMIIIINKLKEYSINKSLERKRKLPSQHAGVGSDDISDGSSADGTLEPLSLQLQPTGHTDTHMTTTIHDRVYDAIRADDTVTSLNHSCTICLIA